MTIRKFVSEFGVNVLSDGQLLCQQEDLVLEVVQAWLEREGGHIYAICQRPRIALDDTRITIDAAGMRGFFRAQTGPDWRDIPFFWPASNDSDVLGVTVHCPYPFSRFEIRRGGTVMLEGKPATLMQNMLGCLDDSTDAAVLDLEVLYVGQAYGDAGGRNAADRLNSHSTLQTIYREAMKSTPDKDVWLVLFGFQEPFLLASFDGRRPITTTTLEEDDAHIAKVTSQAASGTVSEQTRINYAEAAMIHYFKPAYNVQYKDTFPSALHKAYSECYSLDLNTVCVEIQTEDSLQVRLYSQKADALWTHFIQYPLNSEEERKAMFDL